MARYFQMHYSVSSRKDLSLAAKAIYGVLSSFERMGGAFPAQDTIADWIGVSTRHVRNGLTELENAGLLAREKRNGGRVNRYKLVPVEADDRNNSSAVEPMVSSEKAEETFRNKSSALQAPIGRNVPPNAEETFLQERKKRSEKAEELFLLKEDSLKDSLKDGSDRGKESLIEEILERYPNKVKLDLAAQYLSELSVEGLINVRDGLTRWLASEQWGKDRGKWIPAAGTFMAQKAWKDFPKPAPTLDETPLFVDEEAA